MTQLILDLTESKKLKSDGLKQVAAHNAEWLYRMRKIAKRLAAEHGSVSADELRVEAAKEGIEEPSHPNAYGSVFNRSQWEPVGWKPNELKSAHARSIRIWRLK